MSDDESTTIDSSFARWALVSGTRVSVAAALLLGVLVLAVVTASVGLLSGTPSSPMYFLFSSIFGGNLTLVTVVLSINQLVLSRELGAPGELHQRIREAVEYRREAEETSGSSPSPVSPTGFLRFLHEAVDADARALRESLSVETTENEQLHTRVGSLVDDLSGDAESVRRTLNASSVDIFAVIEATLGTNHASQLYEIAAIEAEFDGLTDEQERLLDRIREQLLHIDTARKYFRTVYIEKELSYLSRILLYVGVPVEILTGGVLAVYGAVGSTPPPPEWMLPFVVVSLTAGFAPLAVLFAFVLRLSWVAQRNTSVAPFADAAERDGI
ncbi:hypothetical protein NDI76_20195 [Halogeometricum sp. S1BR25-6]|uniref:Uncharacterized protein n=1 Tax=Halogeometricum salsisoli TaxID=2950536 RepID=A0ABU2GL97_9EURY|nr:hypothetical protein [Halogeometricum sp. S1BR25-6]MDS0301063.1 hypothetical protein [Halogeometricum sp. S1BR25-6]